jgi:putative nucleotidyltransferase with HDIG domain
MNLSARATSAIKSLPAFPPAAARVITLLADDSVPTRELAAALSTDAALSAEVLRLANSPLFSPRSEIGGLVQAVSFIGTARLTGLMLTLSFSRVLKRVKSSPLVRRLWRHNLASALAAKEFAHSFGLNGNDAYNPGLFHDIGRLAFMAAEPALYESLVRSGADVQTLEREHFGADHSEVGADLLELWKLPKVFADVARHHHAPPRDGTELIMLVNASCAVANHIGFSIAEDDPIELAADDRRSSSINEAIDVLEREYGIR